MFSYLRYFAIISFIMVILAALGFGIYFRGQASQDLQRIAETNNISLAQSFINTTWKKHLPNLKRLRAINTSLWGNYREFRQFTEDTFRHFEGVPVPQLNIYTGNGTLVASISRDAEISYTGSPTDRSIPDDADSAALFNQAMAGSVASQVVEDASIKTPTGQEIRGTVVQTIIPIMPESYSSVIAGAQAEPEGFIEVVYDISSQWKELTAFQFWVTTGIIVLFVVLLATLLLVAKRAESIISTQHEANVELAATAAKAEAESRQKSQFLANVSHELRTPLNAIIGFSEIIKNQVMGALGNDQYMNYINDIHSSGVHLLSLINDILDFSKAEAGKLELQLSELDATKLIQNCMRLVSPRAEQAKVNLETSLPKEHFIITGDAKKLKQVLLNLLSNSVKFTPENGTVKVTAWQNVMDDSISIEVQDSGIGISPKDISRAMSPFGQVDSKLSRKYEGTGLGLPLTKKFVEIMGGTFKIESELNVGTTITITIPLTPPQHVVVASNQNKEEADTQSNEASDAMSPPSASPAEAERQVSPQLMQSSKMELALDQPGSGTTPPPVEAPEMPRETPPAPPPHGISRVAASSDDAPIPMSAPITPELETSSEPQSAPTPPSEPVEAPSGPQQATPMPSPSLTQPLPTEVPASTSAPEELEPPSLSIPAPPPAPTNDAETSLQPVRRLTDVAPPPEPTPAPSMPQNGPVEAPPPPSQVHVPETMPQDGPVDAPPPPQAPSAPVEPAQTTAAPASKNTKFTSYDALKKMAAKQGIKSSGTKPKRRDLPESSDASEF